MSKQSRPARLEVEVLERRELPSADLLSHAFAHGPEGMRAPWAPPASADTTMNLVIQGTSVQYNSLGIPDFMTGNIYSAAAPSGRPIGQYQEVLTPIFANGQFVGTTGVATFTFFVSFDPHIVLETITTQDVSLIQGVDPATGALLVASTGTVTNASGIFGQVTGSFTSTSDVTLGPSFSDATTVQFTVQGSPAVGFLLLV